MIQISAWPPPLLIATLPPPGQQPLVVPVLCPRHRPTQCVAPSEESRLRGLVMVAFGQLPTTQLELSGDWSKFPTAVKAAAPLCCALGDAKMDELTRQVPAIWALRS